MSWEHYFRGNNLWLSQLHLYLSIYLALIFLFPALSAGTEGSIGPGKKKKSIQFSH